MHLAHLTRPLFGRPREAGEHELRERRRHGYTCADRFRWRTARPSSRGIGVMRRITGQQLVGERAKAVDVVRDRRRLAFVLLRAGIER